MDYQGNYFPDEQDENQSKIYRVVKGIFKWTMYGISFLIYAIIFYMLIANRDSEILETNYMAELRQLENVDTNSMELYRINTKVFMNDDGSLQLHSIDYSEEYGIMEIGIKFNARKLTDSKYDNVIGVSLTDGNGNTYPIENTLTDKGGRYGFMRLCFTGMNLDLDSNDLRYNEDEPTEPRTNEVYYLKVYRLSDGELLYNFTIYDNSTTFTKTEYEE